MVHFFASDAHDIKRRPPLLSRCYRKVEKEKGKEIADLLLQENPEAVINGRPLPPQPDWSEGQDAQEKAQLVLFPVGPVKLRSRAQAPISLASHKFSPRIASAHALQRGCISNCLHGLSAPLVTRVPPTQGSSTPVQLSARTAVGNFTPNSGENQPGNWG